MKLICVGKYILTWGLMPTGLFGDVQTVCSEMFTHLVFSYSNFLWVHFPSLHASLSPSVVIGQNIHFLFSKETKIPDHKTAGHVKSRPIQFLSGCRCSALSTVGKCSVLKHTITRFHPAMVRQNGRLFFLKITFSKCSHSPASVLHGGGTYAWVSS